MGPASLLTIGGTTLRLDLMSCPPQGLAGEAAACLWADGEVTKKDCPAECADGQKPAVVHVAGPAPFALSTPRPEDDAAQPALTKTANESLPEFVAAKLR